MNDRLTSLRAMNRNVANGLVGLTRRNPALAAAVACDILGVPTKTRNHDQKNFSPHETLQVDEGTRTVPFECDGRK